MNNFCWIAKKLKLTLLSQKNVDTETQFNYQSNLFHSKQIGTEPFVGMIVSPYFLLQDESAWNYFVVDNEMDPTHQYCMITNKQTINQRKSVGYCLEAERPLIFALKHIQIYLII